MCSVSAAAETWALEVSVSPASPCIISLKNCDLLLIADTLKSRSPMPLYLANLPTKHLNNEEPKTLVVSGQVDEGCCVLQSVQ